ncbi:PREDICTED: two pore potassium channel c-like isoform X3 [Nelumbo nucifera]|uniref:Two pore potassium channel c-like isoform X3 n=1 Tax=Nelumbo nucifera TaxID=4432 RepID=A0A1U8B4A8_NELNU|nr:PREDICTED: two pore potassium channel c-like isoform X3 [Nelumbo nucifera]
MDELLLSNKALADDSGKGKSTLNLKKDFTSSCFLDLGSPLRQSAAHIINTEAIIPILSPQITRAAANSSSVVNLLANLSKRRELRRHSHSAPSLFTETRGAPSIDQCPSSRSTPSIVRLAFIGVVLYIAAGVAIFMVTSGSFTGHSTFSLVDALYFTVVTLCTIGYGDIVPGTTFTKLFTCAFILVGFGFIDILLNGLVVYVLDRQETVLLSAVDENRLNTVFQTYIIDTVKGRMRIRMKVALALFAVFGCIAIGTIMVHVLEGLDWTDSFYLSVTSVTTVGYGDYSFKTLKGRCFAIIWLLVSTLAVARAFLYLTELRIEKRNRKIAKWVLQKKITLGDLVAADLDNDGSISKSEYVIYKLKEMGKIAEKDILQICNQFDRLDTGNCGKITLADLMENHH